MDPLKGAMSPMGFRGTVSATVPPPALDLPEGITSGVCLLSLQATSLSLQDGDPVSTWQDGSGNALDFSQTGTACPLFRSDESGGYLAFDGVDDYLDGGNHLDNPQEMTLFVVHQTDPLDSSQRTVLSKLAEGYPVTGWAFWMGYQYWSEEGANYYSAFTDFADNWTAFTLDCFVVSSPGSALFYEQGVAKEMNYWNGPSNPLVTSTSNSETLKVGIYGAGANGFSKSKIKSILIYDHALSEQDRQTVEQWLAAKYGLTLP